MQEKGMGPIIAIIGIVVIVAGVIGLVATSGDDEDSTDTSTNNAATSEVVADTSEDASDEEQAAVAESTIVDLAVATESLSTLVTAVTAADLVETLSNVDANFTVFAPTNDAFGALPEGTLDSLLAPEGLADLTDILTFHVVNGEAFSTDLTDGQVIETLNGGTLTVGVTDAGVTINGANVVLADVDASNGVVHVIDGVLLP